MPKKPTGKPPGKQYRRAHQGAAILTANRAMSLTWYHLPMLAKTLLFLYTKQWQKPFFPNFRQKNKNSL